MELRSKKVVHQPLGIPETPSTESDPESRYSDITMIIPPSLYSDDSKEPNDNQENNDLVDTLNITQGNGAFCAQMARPQEQMSVPNHTISPSSGSDRERAQMPNPPTSPVSTLLNGINLCLSSCNDPPHPKDMFLEDQRNFSSNTMAAMAEKDPAFMLEQGTFPPPDQQQASNLTTKDKQPYPYIARQMRDQQPVHGYQANYQQPYAHATRTLPAPQPIHNHLADKEQPYHHVTRQGPATRSNYQPVYNRQTNDQLTHPHTSRDCYFTTPRRSHLVSSPKGHDQQFFHHSMRPNPITVRRNRNPNFYREQRRPMPGPPPPSEWYHHQPYGQLYQSEELSPAPTSNHSRVLPKMTWQHI